MGFPELTAKMQVWMLNV